MSGRGIDGNDFGPTRSMMSEEPPVPVDVSGLSGFSYACRPGCGLCCYAEPLVTPAEKPPLLRIVPSAEFVSRGRFEFLGSHSEGGACRLLEGNRCRAHAARPSPCREFPLTAHVGVRLQATVVLTCPGVDLAGPSGIPWPRRGIAAARIRNGARRAPFAGQPVRSPPYRGEREASAPHRAGAYGRGPVERGGGGPPTVERADPEAGLGRFSRGRRSPAGRGFGIAPAGLRWPAAPWPSPGIREPGSSSSSARPVGSRAHSGSPRLPTILLPSPRTPPSRSRVPAVLAGAGRALRNGPSRDAGGRRRVGHGPRRRGAAADRSRDALASARSGGSSAGKRRPPYGR